MNPALAKIVSRELSKLQQLSENDDAILAPAHLEALEVLSRILKQQPPDDDWAPVAAQGASLAAALDLVTASPSDPGKP